ncbi:hypothetical protein [Chitinophaga silvisoli]|uniref:Uncharacterized protein n=1 Tax=Chitinophaga silvisoli TaxID=2291814 RepID=A0A3E1P334_9BACT|nr:hypothetical protein [Chitinophaga silvisoli]RFM34408.1 hypothetical protein DXN04_14090 [Chitinophaga silvisoli]
MDSNKLMVRDYLDSLKEDTELDFIFPLLLTVLGYRVIVTPKQAKGNPQFGKDVIAIGKTSDGTRALFYFELKAGSDKNIDDTTMTKQDGIIDSFRTAKYVEYEDHSIPGLNELPRQFVLVHTGTVNVNAQRTLDGFVKREFPDGNFDHWDINHLTDLFSTHLFSEYLLTDPESTRLFKRTLVLLDAPDYDLSDFYQLIEIQLRKITTVNGRSLTMFFATMNLLSAIILNYSENNNNLNPAKEAITYVVLRVWRFIIENKWERKRPILKHFGKIVSVHSVVLQKYFNKLLPIISKRDGFYSEKGGFFEYVGGPLRTYDVLGYMIYHFTELEFKENEKDPYNKTLREEHKRIIREVINNNSTCVRPLLDNHSIVICMVILYFMKRTDFSTRDRNFLHAFIKNTFDNIGLNYIYHQRLPELHSNVEALIEFVSTKMRPTAYTDSSSMLIPFLLEISVILGFQDIYENMKGEFAGVVNFQLPQFVPGSDIETILFSDNAPDEYFTEASLTYPDSMTEALEKLKAIPIESHEWKIEKAGFPYVRLLAHHFFKNDFVPSEWRRKILE